MASLERIAKENGYELKSIPSEDVAVRSFEDRTSKNNSYPDLEDGKVQLVATTYSDTSNKQLAYCGGTGLVGDETHTILIFAIALPSFKH